MRLFIFLALFTALMASMTFTSCGSAEKTLCDTACNSDTLRFAAQHEANPFVAIGFKGCEADTVTWSHDLLTSKRKLVFTDLTGKDVKINKAFMRHYIKDTSYVWLLFNDCITSQGFMVKLPFNKTSNISRKNSALNGIDPKFSVAENLVVYTDKGNIFIEDMSTGQQATMTFGKKVESMEYAKIHESIDSLKVTANHAWIKIKIDNEWQVIEKDITLK
jgi:hypothetical protein